MLQDETCDPKYTSGRPLTAAEVEELLRQINGWNVIEVDGIQRLKKEFRFQDFNQSLNFTNSVGQIADQQNHHPAILTEWGKVTVNWWTHRVRGLHRNDFIMAARTDAISSI